MPKVLRDLDDETTEIFAENVRTERRLRGWSMERLAKEAGIALDTVFRVEHALPSTTRIRTKIANALETTYRRLTLRSRSIQPGYAIHRRADDLWNVLWESRNYAPPPEEDERIQTSQERRRLGGLGFVKHFVQLLNCRLHAGKLVAGIIEVYGQGDMSTYVAGEVFVYVLQGLVTVRYGTDAFDLAEGEAATIRCGLEEFGFDPGQPGGSAQLLYVRLDEVPAAE